MICTAHTIFFGDKNQEEWEGHVARMGERKGVYNIFRGGT